MKDTSIKIAWAIAGALIAASSFPLIAQQAGASATAQESASAHAGGAQVNESGKADASAGVEMRPVSGELENKLDSKTAKVGDAVVVRTKAAVKTADGTVIPKGARLVGRVTDVQAHGSGNADSRVAVQFDRAEWKAGGSAAIVSRIESVEPPANLAAADSAQADAGFSGGPIAGGGGRASGGGRVGGGGLVGGTVGGVTSTTASAGSGLAATTGGALHTTGGLAGDATANVGSSVHQAAGATGGVVTHATGIPGVSLSSEAAGSATGNISGTLFGSKRNVHLDGGTQILMGVAAAASAR